MVLRMKNFIGHVMRGERLMKGYRGKNEGQEVSVEIVIGMITDVCERQRCGQLTEH